jgi:hypothetical protein
VTTAPRGAMLKLTAGPGVTVTPVVATTGPPAPAMVPVTGKFTPATVAEKTLLPGGGPRNAFPPEVVKVTSAVAFQALPKASVAVAL